MERKFNGGDPCVFLSKIIFIKRGNTGIFIISQILKKKGKTIALSGRRHTLHASTQLSYLMKQRTTETPRVPEQR